MTITLQFIGCMEDGSPCKKHYLHNIYIAVRYLSLETFLCVV